MSRWSQILIRFAAGVCAASWRGGLYGVLSYAVFQREMLAIPGIAIVLVASRCCAAGDCSGSAVGLYQIKWGGACDGAVTKESGPRSSRVGPSASTFKCCAPSSFRWRGLSDRSLWSRLRKVSATTLRFSARERCCDSRRLERLQISEQVRFFFVG